MGIRERALSILGNPDKKAVRDSLLQKTSIFCWETGLGPALNALPSVFGQQAVLYFPGRSAKYSFPCLDIEDGVFLAVTGDELKKLNALLLQSPGVEIWMKDGWYAGTVRLLTLEEQDQLSAKISSGQFFGSAGKLLGRSPQKAYRLLEVTRSAPCTGNSGPGSKSWVWPLAVCLLLFSKKKK